MPIARRPSRLSKGIDMPSQTPSIVYLDTETTGLRRGVDEVLEIAICADDGSPLLDTLVRPVRQTSWDEAQDIHGITPAMVQSAPTLEELAPCIRAAVQGAVVVIYNAAFDQGMLPGLLDGAAHIECCMEAYAKHNGEWSSYFGNWRWVPLSSAAEQVCHEWGANAAHRAAADALACRSVWRYLQDPEERVRVEQIWKRRRLEEWAKWGVPRWVDEFWAERRKAEEQRSDEQRATLVERLRLVIGPELDRTIEELCCRRSTRLDDLYLAFWGVNSSQYAERQRRRAPVEAAIKGGAQVVARKQDLPSSALLKTATRKLIYQCGMSSSCFDLLSPRYVVLPNVAEPWRGRIYYDAADVEQLPLGKVTFTSREAASFRAGRPLFTATELRRKHRIKDALPAPVTWFVTPHHDEYPLYDMPSPQPQGLPEGAGASVVLSSI